MVSHHPCRFSEHVFENHVWTVLLNTPVYGRRWDWSLQKKVSGHYMVVLAPTWCESYQTPQSCSSSTRVSSSGEHMMFTTVLVYLQPPRPTSSAAMTFSFRQKSQHISTRQFDSTFYPSILQFLKIIHTHLILPPFRHRIYVCSHLVEVGLPV